MPSNFKPVPNYPSLELLDASFIPKEDPSSRMLEVDKESLEESRKNLIQARKEKKLVPPSVYKGIPKTKEFFLERAKRRKAYNERIESLQMHQGVLEEQAFQRQENERRAKLRGGFNRTLMRLYERAQKLAPQIKMVEPAVQKALSTGRQARLLLNQLTPYLEKPNKYLKETKKYQELMHIGRFLKSIIADPSTGMDLNDIIIGRGHQFVERFQLTPRNLFIDEAGVSRKNIELSIGLARKAAKGEPFSFPKAEAPKPKYKKALNRKVSLTDYEKKTAKILGVSEEYFLKSKAVEGGRETELSKGERKEWERRERYGIKAQGWKGGRPAPGKVNYVWAAEYAQHLDEQEKRKRGEQSSISTKSFWKAAFYSFLQGGHAPAQFIRDIAGMTKDEEYNFFKKIGQDIKEAEELLNEWEYKLDLSLIYPAQVASGEVISAETARDMKLQNPTYRERFEHLHNLKMARSAAEKYGIDIYKLEEPFMRVVGEGFWGTSGSVVGGAAYHYSTITAATMCGLGVVPAFGVSGFLGTEGDVKSRLLGAGSSIFLGASFQGLRAGFKAVPALKQASALRIFSAASLPILTRMLSEIVVGPNAASEADQVKGDLESMLYVAALEASGVMKRRVINYGKWQIAVWHSKKYGTLPKGYNPFVVGCKPEKLMKMVELHMKNTHSYPYWMRQIIYDYHYGLLVTGQAMPEGYYKRLSQPSSESGLKTLETATGLDYLQALAATNDFKQNVFGIRRLRKLLGMSEKAVKYRKTKAYLISEKELEGARAYFRKTHKFFTFPALDPEGMKAATKIGVGLIEEGVTEFKKWRRDMYRTLKVPKEEQEGRVAAQVKNIWVGTAKRRRDILLTAGKAQEKREKSTERKRLLRERYIEGQLKKEGKKAEADSKRDLEFEPSEPLPGSLEPPPAKVASAKIEKLNVKNPKHWARLVEAAKQPGEKDVTQHRANLLAAILRNDTKIVNTEPVQKIIRQAGFTPTGKASPVIATRVGEKFVSKESKKPKKAATYSEVKNEARKLGISIRGKKKAQLQKEVASQKKEIARLEALSEAEFDEEVFKATGKRHMPPKVASVPMTLEGNVLSEESRPSTPKKVSGPLKASGLSVDATLFNTPREKFAGYAWRVMSRTEYNKLLAGQMEYGGKAAKKGNWLAQTPESAAQFKSKGKVLVEFGGVEGYEGSTTTKVVGKGNITGSKVWNGKKWTALKLPKTTVANSELKAKAKKLGIEVKGLNKFQLLGAIGRAEGNLPTRPFYTKDIFTSAADRTVVKLGELAYSSEMEKLPALKDIPVMLRDGRGGSYYDAFHNRIVLFRRSGSAPDIMIASRVLEHEIIHARDVLSGRVKPTGEQAKAEKINKITAEVIYGGTPPDSEVKAKGKAKKTATYSEVKNEAKKLGIKVKGKKKAELVEEIDVVKKRALYKAAISREEVLIEGRMAPWELTFTEYKKELSKLTKESMAAERDPGRKLSKKEFDLMHSDWRAFSRMRGYTEAEIAEYSHFREFSRPGKSALKKPSATAFDVHRSRIEDAIAKNVPISAQAAKEHKISLPKGWTRVGESYIPPKKGTFTEVMGELEKGVEELVKKGAKKRGRRSKVWRLVIRKAKEFKKGAMEGRDFKTYHEWGGEKLPEGVQVVVGVEKGTGNKAVMKVNFDKGIWPDEGKALEWGKNNTGLGMKMPVNVDAGDGPGKVSSEESSTPSEPHDPAALYKSINERVSLLRHVSISLPFYKLDSKRTGDAAVEVPGTVEATMRWTNNRIGKISKLGRAFNEGDWWSITQCCQQPKLISKLFPKEKRAAAKKVVGIFKLELNRHLRRHLSTGALREGWPASLLRESQTAIKDARLELKNVTSDHQKADIESRIVRYEEAIKYCKEVNPRYVPSAIMENIWRKNPRIFRRALTRHFLKRTTLDSSAFFKELLEDGVVTMKDVDMRRIFFDYSYKSSKMFALDRVLKRGSDEGLVWVPKKGEGDIDAPQGWSKIERSGRYRNAYSHPVLSDFLRSWSSHGEWGQFRAGRFLTYVKSGTFLQPWRLAMNDLWQHFYLTNFRFYEAPWHMAKAVKSMIKQGPEHWAVRSTLLSQPFVPSYDRWMTDFEVAMENRGIKKAWAFIEAHFRSHKPGKKWFEPKKPVKTVGRFGRGAYETFLHGLHKAAWTGDETVRFATYYAMRKRGLGMHEAALVSARIHGHYSDMPFHVKRLFNVLFYTPTYTRAMFDVTLRSMGAFYETVTRANKMKGTRQHELSQRLLGRAWLGMIAAGVARNTLFASLGFKVVGAGIAGRQFGYKYEKEVEIDGKKHILNAFLATPDNAAFRYMWAGVRAAKSEDPFNTLVNGMKWKTQPVWRAFVMALQNKQADGSDIANWHDDTSGHTLRNSKQYLKFFVHEMLPVTKAFLNMKADDSSRKAKLAALNDMGRLWSLVLSPFAFYTVREGSFKDKQRSKEFWLFKSFKSKAFKMKREGASHEELDSLMRSFRSTLKRMQESFKEEYAEYFKKGKEEKGPYEYVEIPNEELIE